VGAGDAYKHNLIDCREVAFANMGIAESCPDAPLITMITKQGRRAIENAEDIIDRLQAKYKGVAFKTLHGEDIAVMSIQQQVSWR